MNLDRMTMAYARRALREAVYHHFSDPNVTLIEFGFKERGGQRLEDEVAIRFHMHQKLSEFALETAVEHGQTRRVPEVIGGFQTDVAEGTYYPHWRGWGSWPGVRTTNPRAVQADPMRGGISISDERHHAYGTLGGLVVDRVTGAEMMITNWHVAAADWLARPGQRIYQPGRLDGGNYSHTVAALTRDAMSVNLDAAVATLNNTNNSRRLINDQLDLGPIQGVGQASLGMQVVKSGRRTGVTTGRVMAVEGVAKIQYGHLERLIRKVIRIEPEWQFGEVSGPGDSGSIWLERGSMEAIGLHFAGSNQPERGLALDMVSVLDALNVNLVTGG